MSEKGFIEIHNGSSLRFCFKDISEKFHVSFQKTLRIPDDNKKYPLPPSLGTFPLEHVENYSRKVPSQWIEHGGVFMPMYQSEAMWLNFQTDNQRPFAIKVASGKINAVSGKEWTNFLDKDKQDYMVTPGQPWLDGFHVGKDVIRQFVAVPLKSGYTVEEQITGEAEHGGIQIIVYPMKDVYWQKELQKREEARKAREGNRILRSSKSIFLESPIYASASLSSEYAVNSLSADMGLGAGGYMTQQIYEDKYGLDVWDQTKGLRIFIHLLNSQQYTLVTGKANPSKPLSAKDYQSYHYPWFDYYSDLKALDNSDNLSFIESIGSLQTKKGEVMIEESSSPFYIQSSQIHKIKNGKW
jgi:hypothetical protein